MSITPQNSRVTILVKALPQPSKKYGETVCCAGVTPEGHWKRLFPIRYRHLQGNQSFKRWDQVTFKYRSPHQDKRAESCHVFEDSIAVEEALPKAEQTALLNRVVVSSADHAMKLGQSLALIRPSETLFSFKKKTEAQLVKERDAYFRAASQGSFFDKALAALAPTPYRFGFTFKDASGKHAYQCGDWETHAMFFNSRRRIGEEKTLKWMNETFNNIYPSAGMVFAIGNLAKRPQTWQLLGIIPLDESTQGELQL